MINLSEIAKKLSERITNAETRQRSTNVPEVFRNIKSNFAVKLYELMFKNNN